VKRMLLTFESRQHAEPESTGSAAVSSNTKQQQMLALVLSFETSTGRVQGKALGGGPGTNLVIVTGMFVNFLLRAEWYNQTELLRPADFMKHRDLVFNHALLFYSTSPILRELCSHLLRAANDRLTASTQIGSEASIAVLDSVMRFNMLSV
jgi:hypothetical protein